MIKKLYALLAASSVMVCSAAQPGLTIDGQTILTAEELQNYVVAGCPEATIGAIQQAIAAEVAAATLTEQQKEELTVQYILRYVEFMVERCFFEVLILVDARDSGKIHEIVFAQRLPLLAEFEQQFIAHVRNTVAQLSEAQIAELKQELATARKVDVATISAQDLEAAVLFREYMGVIQTIANRHKAELAEGVVDLLVEAVVAAVHKV